MQKPIYIIGVGAIGMTLAVLLKQAGKEVILIRGRPDSQPDAHGVKIILDCTDGITLEATVPISSLDQFTVLDGFILLTTKAFGNPELAQRLIGKTGHSPLLLLQNGLGVEDPFIEADFPDVYRCVLLATSQVQAPFNVRYKPVAASPIGVIRGHESGLAELVEQLNTLQFPFRIEKSIQGAVWEKVISNCVFNAICPLLGVDNGIFHRNASALALARELIDECLAVANEAGITLNQMDIESRLLQISQCSDGQLISTLVDIQKGYPTEIESLNLAVARLAQRLGNPNLANRTRLLGELIKLKSELSRVPYQLTDHR